MTNPDKTFLAFQHTPLDTTRQQIRLITLDSSQDSVDISCRVRCTDIKDAGAYIAVSYAWGDPTPTRTILVDGASLEIRENLYNFLWYFRNDVSSTTNLWIDQISIDQNNVSERNHQVQLMSQIYKNSEIVLSWLGCAEDDVRAVHMFEETGKFHHLQPLLYNSYFTRLWIVQEILLAPKLFLMCKDQWITRASMQSLVESCPWEKVPNVPLWLFSEGASIHTAGRPDVEPSLAACIRRYSKNHCSDPRDKVYALLGLMPEKLIRRVSYDKSVVEVFLDCVNEVSWELCMNWEFFVVDVEQVPKQSEIQQTSLIHFAMELGQTMAIDQRILSGLPPMLRELHQARRKHRITRVGFEPAGFKHTSLGSDRWYIEYCNSDGHTEKVHSFFCASRWNFDNVSISRRLQEVQSKRPGLVTLIGAPHQRQGLRTTDRKRYDFSLSLRRLRLVTQIP